MTSVAQLDELLALGFIQASEYERRRSELEFAPSASASPLPVTQPAPVPASTGLGEHVTLRPSEAAVAAQVRAKDERVVRVFVSSTLRDMEDERRLLVQRVFPAVKAACRARRVAFSYVDFQWGITDEAARDGQVVALCLREVERCRPYVVAMLGERYGWAQGGPGSVPDALLAKSLQHASEHYSWVTHYADRSVTELELLYAALFYPALASHAYIYLRDTAYSRTHEGVRQFATQSDNDYDAQRLAALKAALRASGLPVRDQYATPGAFADLVEADLLAAIERDFPLSELPPSDALSEEQRLTRQFMADVANLFVAREMELATLHAFIAEAHTAPLLLLGDEGVGKTALLAQFVQARAVTYPDALLLPVFFGLHYTTMTPVVHQILTALVRHFKLAAMIPEEPSAQLLLLASWLRHPPFATPAHPVVLVLDGLNVLNEHDDAGALAWLPPHHSPHFRLVLAAPHTRAHTHLARLYGDVLRELRVEVLPDVARRALVEATLTPLGKALSSAHTHALVSAPCAGSPLFLRAVLHQLAMHSSHTQLSATLDELVTVRDLGALFDNLLTSWEAQCGALLSDVFALLAVSHAGLLEAELAALVPGHAQLAWARMWATVGDVVRSTSGVLTLATLHLRRAVARRYLQDGTLVSLRERLSSFCEAKSGVDRLLLEHVHHLVALQRPLPLLKLVSGPHALRLFELLFTPLAKDVLFSAWRASGSEHMAANVYTSAVLARAGSAQEEARLVGRIAAFLREAGHVQSALSLFGRCVAQSKSAWGAASPEYAEALFAHAAALVEAAQYDDALRVLNECRALRSGELARAECAWLEALVCKKRGAYAEARKLLESALAGACDVLGAGHPSVAQYRLTLGDVLRKQGAYDDAERVYTEALAVTRQHFGNAHAAVAELLDALGRVHKKQGRYEAAEARFVAARDLVAQTHGSAHSLYAQCTFNLGDVRRKLGDYEGATKHYEAALAFFQRIYGAAHPETAEALNALGDVDRLCGRLSAAVTRIEAAISVAQAALGVGSEKVARFTCNLAAVHSIAARYEQASALYSRAIVVQQHVLGESHPDTAETLSALAHIMKKRGRYVEARELYERAMAALEAALGPAHVKVAQCALELGHACRKLKARDAAMASYERARDVYAVAVGPTSAPVAEALNGLGLLLKTLGGDDLDAAERFHRDALAIFERVHGAESAPVAATLNYLAEALRKQGKVDYDGAEVLYERALRINRALFGDEHPEVAENLNGLAQVYTLQLNYDKAEPLFVRAIATSERTLTPTHPHVRHRYRNLQHLYERQGLVAKADGVAAKLAELEAQVQAEEAV